MSYDGIPMAVYYDEVVHYRCCEQAMFNPAGNSVMTWFYARRDQSWYYVELGNYN